MTFGRAIGDLQDIAVVAICILSSEADKSKPAFSLHQGQRREGVLLMPNIEEWKQLSQPKMKLAWIKSCRPANEGCQQGLEAVATSLESEHRLSSIYLDQTSIYLDEISEILIQENPSCHPFQAAMLLWDCFPRHSPSDIK